VVADGLHVLPDEVIFLVDLEEPLVLSVHGGGLLYRVPKWDQHHAFLKRAR
jgi:hypothetical protein